MAKNFGLLGYFLIIAAITAGYAVHAQSCSSCPTIPSTYNCSGYSQACYDCQTMAYCQTLPNNTVQYLTSDSCGGTTPYCNSTTRVCQSTVTSNCAQTMNCSSFGTNFPMPNQCNTYLQCFINGTQAVGVCSNSSFPYYSSTTFSCQRAPVSCAINCPSTSQVNVPFPSDSRFYAACMNGKPKLVYRCRPPTTFQTSLGYCSTPCAGEGVNSNPNDCHSYLQCTATSRVAVAKTCPPGFVFDLNIYECNNATSTPTPLTVQPCVP